MDELFDRRYQIHHGIARVSSGGGVYAAEHAFTHKTCAIKILDADVDDIVRKRALREMEALARAQGPGVVEFHDAGEIASRIYLVMELLKGRTLGGLLAAKGRLEISDAIAICTRIAEVLARCHALGIVHRDVKPLNVYVSTNGAVHVLDMGIAKIDTPKSGEKLTLENTLLGTPEYMAPEALLASPDVDHRADQYSLGVTMYECLTGVVPFEGKHAQIAKNILSKAITPVETQRPDVPHELARWVARALERDPDARFVNMAEMHAALRTLDVRLPPTGSAEGHARVAATMADSPSAKRPQSRRRHPRARYASLAQLMRTEKRAIDGRVEEISEGGCQFVADTSPDAGETVTVRFALPISGRVIEAGGVCRWSRATRVAMASGFEFPALPPEATADIRRYVLLMGE